MKFLVAFALTVMTVACSSESSSSTTLPVAAPFWHDDASLKLTVNQLRFETPAASVQEMNLRKQRFGYGISWPPAEQATSYEVLVDGVVVATTSERTHAGELQGKKRLSVIALNDAGARSPEITVVAFWSNPSKPNTAVVASADSDAARGGKVLASLGLGKDIGSFGGTAGAGLATRPQSQMEVLVKATRTTQAYDVDVASRLLNDAMQKAGEACKRQVKRDAGRTFVFNIEIKVDKRGHATKPKLSRMGPSHSQLEGCVRRAAASVSFPPHKRKRSFVVNASVIISVAR